jgi:hypothetical protein
VNTSPEAEWQSILSALLKETQPEVQGREQMPEELQRQLERLARGDFNSPEKAAEVQEICEKVARSQEALACLAKLLNEARS